MSHQQSFRDRFLFLDGVRGFAALYIVFHHAWAEVDYQLDGSAFPQYLQFIPSLLQWGHFVVCLFIVLSGFCLMLPIGTSENSNLRGGILAYYKRRAIRILPAYWASTLFSLFLIATVPSLNHQSGQTRWDIVLPVWDPFLILNHLLLLHIFNPIWAARINHTHWAIASEWYIYIIFPVLLYLWRHLGMVKTILIAFAIGLTPHYLQSGWLDWACPWFLGLFALGMQAALIINGRDQSFQDVPWGLLSAFSSLLTCLIIYYSGFDIWQSANWQIDTLVGFTVLSLLIALARGSYFTKIFESVQALELGKLSYSLYLTHLPILALINSSMILFHIGSLGRFCILIIFGTPLAVATAYCFARIFERKQYQ